MSNKQGISVDTDDIRRRLLAERMQLLARPTLPNTNPLTPDERDSDEADAAVSTALREQALWLQEDQRQKLEMIDRALERIANGSYETCVTCGGDISPERLEAVPYTTQCIRCQEAAERHRRRGSRGRRADLTNG